MENGRYEDGCYGSLPGVSLIAKVLAGRCKMHYTRVAVGKGAIPEDSNPKTMTEPAGYVMDAKISDIGTPIDGECQVTVQINSADVETGFYCTSLLLYAEDPDLGEVPYTYLVLEGEPEWIRPASSIVGKLATFDIIAAVGDVDVVSAAIDPEAFATIRAVQKYIKEELAKYPIGGYYGTYIITLPVNGWVQASETPPDYKFICDVEETEATGAFVPVGGCMPGYFSIADRAGMMSGCESCEGYIRFYAKRVPEQDIMVAITLFSKGGAPSSGIGQGLEYGTDGRLAVKVGHGLTFDNHDAVAANPQEIITDKDVLDEDETEQHLKEILLLEQSQSD